MRIQIKKLFVIILIYLFIPLHSFSLEQSKPPAPEKVTITNNYGIPSTVKVSGLIAEDIVKIYLSSTSSKLLAQAQVPTKKTEATISITKLTEAEGSLYITVTSKKKLESAKVKVTYNALVVTAAPDDSNITVSNNVRSKSTIIVTDIKSQDVIRAYNSALGGKLLGKAIVAAKATKGTIFIDSLDTRSGQVYVSVASKGSAESSRTKATYEAQPITAPLEIKNISFEHNYGNPSILSVTNLTPSATINVYSSLGGTTKLASSKTGTKKSEITIPINSLTKIAGTLHISVTDQNKIESSRVSVSYPEVAKTAAPQASKIVVENTSKGSGSVKLTDLLAGDIIKIYDSSDSTSKLISIGSTGKTTEAVIKIGSLQSKGGSIFVSVTNKGKLQSELTKVEYTAVISEVTA